MSTKNFINSKTSETNLNEDYLERPRLHTLLKNAMDYRLIIVCAGSGYGKTYAVNSFLKQYCADVTWLQISERDNIAARFWESYSNQVSLHWPETGTFLKKTGFPKTNEAFSKYSEIMYEVTSLPGERVWVFDDFHLLHDKNVLRFFEREVNMPSNSTDAKKNQNMILISRTMPELNLISLMKLGSVFTIQEDALCFTEDEIGKYFSQINIHVLNTDLRDIYNDTQGWAFAMNLIGHSLAKKGKYERYALEAMKRNTFRLIEAEIFPSISDPLRHFLLRISLIDHLAVNLINMLAKDEALVREMEFLNAYIRYDFIMDTYMIHHLFRDFLRQKQKQMLTEEERRETYQTAAAWCDANGYQMDAFSYYEKSGDYDAILRKVALLNVQVQSDIAQYALEIFDRMPDEVKSQNPIFPSMYLKLKISLGHLDEAQKFAEQYSQNYEARLESPERSRALFTIYIFWGLLRMKMCTYTDMYDFENYFIKAAEYFSKNPFKFIGSSNITSTTAWASQVGTNRPGAMEEYITAVSRITPYLSYSMNGLYSGVEELVRGELCFYQRSFIDAEQYLNQSIYLARKHDQYITQNRALVYLMHIDFSRGDLKSASARLKKMETLLSEKDYGVRYTIYDIACGFYYLALDLPEQIPQWLKGGFSPFTHSSFLENYANRIRARYHFQTHQYSALLEFIENALKHPAILFGKLELLALQALSLYQIKRRDESIAVFTEAYSLAESNKIVTSFTEYAKYMRTLVLAACKDNTCPIPKKWLEGINRISSSYAKWKAKMISAYTYAEEIRITAVHKTI